MNKQSGFIGILIAIVVVLGITGYVVYDHKLNTEVVSLNTNPSDTAAIPNDESSEPKTVTSTQTTTGTSITDNGSVTVKMSNTTTENCGTAGCFEQHFAACTPAKADITGAFDTSRYEIIGSVPGGCKMTEEYTSLMMDYTPSWKNKPMTCTYDNRVNVATAVAQMHTNILNGENVTCTGPLYQTLLAAGVSIRNSQ
ncbi:MAG: hypothetical protein KBD54_02530 [Candidatus Pacebacteria bacterium]|jgi:archaellum component FlaF (FlaF/FlaG flagellin family)|nr:hypothetical protein [Candidatus Paceibacterota bacterium]